MSSAVISLLLTLRSSVRSRARLHLEILALRHQLHVLERSRPRRVPLTPADRVLWVWLSRVWPDWRAVVIVKPDNDPRVASARLPPRLGVEESPPRATDRRRRGAHPDSHDVGRQPAVGRPTHPRRTPQARRHDQSGGCREVHGGASASALPDLAHVSRESRPPDHGRRLLRRSDHYVSALIRPGHPGARSAARGARRRHGVSQRRLDRATTPRGLSRRSCPSPRSGWRVRGRRSHG